MEQEIKMLPVTDTKNPLGIFLEDNEDSDDNITQVLISPPITPKEIITEDDNNNENDDNNNNGNIPGVKEI